MLNENELLARLDKLEEMLSNLDKVMVERIPDLITEQLEMLFEKDRHIVMDRTQYLQMLAELQQRRSGVREAKQKVKDEQK